MSNSFFYKAIQNPFSQTTVTEKCDYFGISKEYVDTYKKNTRNVATGIF